MHTTHHPVVLEKNIPKSYPHVHCTCTYSMGIDLIKLKSALPAWRCLHIKITNSAALKNKIFKDFLLYIVM